MLRIKSLLFLATALSAAAMPVAAATITYSAGACGLVGVTSFPTISAALEATPAADVIKVCPGIYNEQIVITRAVTIEGATVGNSGRAMIAVPSGGLHISTTLQVVVPAAAQVFVDNATGSVNLTNITVDGSGAGSVDGGLAIGVLYLNSSGTVNQLETRFLGGKENGVGLWLEGGAADPSVTVENSNIHSFDYVGIVAEALLSKLTAKVTGNTVFAGPTATAGFSLTKFSSGVSLTATGNFINGPSSASAGGAVGVSIAGSANTGSIADNMIVNVDGNGVSDTADGVSVTSNKIYDITGTGIYAAISAGEIEGNTITQAHNGIDYGCTAGPNVTGNILSAIGDVGVINVPTGTVTTTNSYFNVPTISNGGC